VHYAIGGTLDDWAFGVNIAVAVGTIAVSALALWLALRANAERKRAELETAEFNARQVIAVVDAIEVISAEAAGRIALGNTGPFVEIVNASLEAITDVTAVVSIPPESSLAWRWGHVKGSTIPYVLAGEKSRLYAERLGPVDPMDMNPREEDRMEEFRRVDVLKELIRDDRVDVELHWRNGRGWQYSRLNNGEAAIRPARRD
jgi:hypothetical protein